VKRQVRRVTQAKVTVAEQHLLELLVYDPELREKVLSILEETDYEHLATAPIYKAMYELDEKGLEFSLDHIKPYIEDDEMLMDLVPLIMMTEPKREAGEAMDDVFHLAENCILTLRSMAISTRIFEISQDLLAAESSGDHETVV